MAQVIPTAGQLIHFMETYASNNGATEELLEGYFDAISIVGATWAIVPDAPVAVDRVPYIRQDAAIPFDGVYSLANLTEAQRAARVRAEHPQAGFEVDLYGANHAPVMARAVPHLPTQEFVHVMNLVQPQSIGLVQRILKMHTQDEEKLWSLGAYLMTDTGAVDAHMMAGSAIISAVTSTVLRSYNLVGIDVSALEQQMTNYSLNALVNGYTFSPKTTNLIRRADVFSCVRAAISKLTATELPKQVFADRVWGNVGLFAEQAPVALAPRFLFGALPPHHGNALAIDSTLAVRPIEWGIPLPELDADLQAETSVMGYGPNDVGVFSHANTDVFDVAVSGNTPYIFAPVGSLVVQTTLQVGVASIANIDIIPVHEAFCVAQIGKTKFVPAYRQSPAPGNKMNGTVLLVPNTIRTFCHRDVTVCAPALISPHVPLGLVYSANIHKGMVLYGGLGMCRAEIALLQAPMYIHESYDKRVLKNKMRKKDDAASKAAASKTDKSQQAQSQ